MIAFLPELYSDELVYSWLSRYYVKSGCLSFAYVVEDLYVHQYTRPDIEFLNEMKLDVMELIDRYCNIEQLGSETYDVFLIWEISAVGKKTGGI